MKQYLLSVLFLLGAQMSLANTDLELLMEEAGENFKQIAIAIQMQNLTEADQEAAKNLESLFKESRTIIPDTASSEKLIAEYIAQMDQIILLSQDLQFAIESQLNKKYQDFTQVIQLFQEMNQLRQKSHNQFKLD